MSAHESLKMTRRDALRTLGAGAMLAGLGALTGRAVAQETATPSSSAVAPQPFTLPPLAYAYDALEPHLDARTMEIHHSKHHQSYITNANAALASRPELHGMTGEEMLRNIGELPDSLRVTVRNNVGGHVNHSLFWKIIGPNGGGAPKGAFGELLAEKFGSVDNLQKEFNSAAMKRFGSGWAWLCLNGESLVTQSTANQDSPLLTKLIPILGLDVWEHAYYLNYQNRRADYCTAFWNVVNWAQVEANYNAAVKG